MDQQQLISHIDHAIPAFPHTHMYLLDRQNEVVKQLIKLDMALARKSMEKAVEEYSKPVAVKSR